MSHKNFLFIITVDINCCSLWQLGFDAKQRLPTADIVLQNSWPAKYDPYIV